MSMGRSNGAMSVFSRTHSSGLNHLLRHWRRLAWFSGFSIVLTCIMFVWERDWFFMYYHISIYGRRI